MSAGPVSDWHAAYVAQHKVAENTRLAWLEQVREVTRLEAAIEILFDVIKHGDIDHQLWLKNKIAEHFKKPNREL